MTPHRLTIRYTLTYRRRVELLVTGVVILRASLTVGFALLAFEAAATGPPPLLTALPAADAWAGLFAAAAAANAALLFRPCIAWLRAAGHGFTAAIIVARTVAILWLNGLDRPGALGLWLPPLAIIVVLSTRRATYLEDVTRHQLRTHTGRGPETLAGIDPAADTIGQALAAGLGTAAGAGIGLLVYRVMNSVNADRREDARDARADLAAATEALDAERDAHTDTRDQLATARALIHELEARGRLRSHQPRQEDPNA